MSSIIFSMTTSRLKLIIDFKQLNATTKCDRHYIIKSKVNKLKLAFFIKGSWITRAGGISVFILPVKRSLQRSL